MVQSGEKSAIEIIGTLLIIVGLLFVRENVEFFILFILGILILIFGLWVPITRNVSPQV